MSIYRRTDSPFWWYSFWYRRVRFRGSTETASKPEAKRIEADKRAEAKQMMARRNTKEMTINEAFDRYALEITGQPSYDDSERMLANLLSIGKNKLLSEITDNDVSLYVAKRRSARNRRGSLIAPATVNRDVEKLRRVFRRAQSAWGVNVALIDWKEHRLMEPRERARELSAQEQADLFANLREDYRALIEFALLSGIRLSNLMRLTWSGVDYNTMTIRMQVKSKEPGGKLHAIPISRAMLEILEGEKGRSPFVFTYECKRSRGKRKAGERYPFSKNGWRKDWKVALDAAGIEDFRFHDLRHTAATRIVRQSGNLKMAMKLLGHSDISATNRYAHVTDDDLRKSLEQSHAIVHVDAKSNKKRRKTAEK